MNTSPSVEHSQYVNIIRFRQRGLHELRTRLLADLSLEHSAQLLAKTEIVGNLRIFTVRDVIYTSPDDYVDQQHAFLHLKKQFVFDVLGTLTNRLDVDALIDVHTHPFAPEDVGFSGVDDRDEKEFAVFLNQNLSDISYGSIVLSQTQYAARIWDVRQGKPKDSPAIIKTQTLIERILSSGSDRRDRKQKKTRAQAETDVYDRTIRALGLETMRAISSDQVVTVIGVGGLGSVIADLLIGMGFQQLVLIDPDTVEMSNLSRLVGATFSDAQQKTAKVDAIAGYLRLVHPHATITPLKADVSDVQVEHYLASSDWLIVATDNHTSRNYAQNVSLKYFVPLISVGVNITVENGSITDLSGEVIVARVGDNLCLHCLGRINYIRLAGEGHTDESVRTALVQRGYVQGLDVREPAVKTLNTMLASLCVDTLINQYTERQRHIPILVYESNVAPCIYEDTLSLERRNLNCYSCTIAS